jgi:coenzyme F420-0:L-glutamate ligase/coenzyme F420-1:gamma-L-glutamate ligase
MTVARIFHTEGPGSHLLLRSRRTVRRYRSEMPSQAGLERIFETVAQAPSAHNRQPWRFRVIRDPSRKAELAIAMGTRLATDRRNDGDPEDAIAADVARSFKRINEAPVLILVALTRREMDAYPDPDRERAEYVMAVQSTAMAAQNLLLAAHIEGLGACWLCAPLFCPAEVRAALALPEDWEPQGLVTLGYPLKAASDKPRKALNDFVVFDADPSART